VTRVVWAALLVQSIVIGGLLLVVADQVAHTRVERLGGVNIWGYRGPVLTQKRANETRLAVVGGDLAFSRGVAASQTLAQAIRDQVSFTLDQPRGSRTVTAVTLAALGLAPSEYASWIERHAALQPDVIVVVADPVRHELVDASYLPARRSAIFKRFGYSPILPLVLRERSAIHHSTPSRWAGDTLASVDALFSADHSHGATVSGPSYLVAIESTIRAGLRAAPAGVVVVTPADAATDSLDRKGVKDLVASTFGAAPVRLVDLGHDPTLREDGLRLDGFNFSTAGYAAVAHDVAPAVLNLLAARESGAR
jgi:hypothetical protein